MSFNLDATVQISEGNLNNDIDIWILGTELLASCILEPSFQQPHSLPLYGLCNG